MRGGASGGSRRHLLLRQPWLGLHAGGHCGHRAGPRWMQVFVYTDRGFTREMVERAERRGYDALVLTIDNQMLGNRERDIRNGFAIPPRFGVAGTLAAATKAAWLLRMRTRLAETDLRQLRASRRDGGGRHAGEPHGRAARPRALLGRRRLAAHVSGPGRCC